MCFQTRDSNNKLPRLERVSFIQVPQDPALRQQYEERLCWWVGEGIVMPEIAFLCDSHFRKEELRGRGKGKGAVISTLPIQQDWRVVAKAFFGTSDESCWRIDPARVSAESAQNGEVVRVEMATQPTAAPTVSSTSLQPPVPAASATTDNTESAPSCQALERTPTRLAQTMDADSEVKSKT
jgi:hypothetical protein